MHTRHISLGVMQSVGAERERNGTLYLKEHVWCMGTHCTQCMTGYKQCMIPPTHAVHGNTFTVYDRTYAVHDSIYTVLHGGDVHMI
jgi:hypothetical protein